MQKFTVKICLYLSAIVAIICGVIACSDGSSTQSSPQYIVSAYFYDDLESIGATSDRLTQVNRIYYSFWVLNDNSGTIYAPKANKDINYSESMLSAESAVDYFNAHPDGYFNDLCNLVANNSNNHYDIVLSVGGWGSSQHFSQTLGNTASRNTFVSNIDYILNNLKCPNTGKPLFNGIDIDWEYPVNRIDFSESTATESASDTANLHLTVGQLRQTFNHENNGYKLITLALPHSNNNPDGGKMGNYFGVADDAEFINNVDQFLDMAYDYMAFAPMTTPDAPLRSDRAGVPSINDGITYLQQTAKVPAHKILFGAPSYARAIGNKESAAVQCLLESATTTNNGLNIDLPPITDVYGTQTPCSVSWINYNTIHMDNMQIFDTVTESTTAQTVIYWNDLTQAVAFADGLASYYDFFASFDSPYNIAQKAAYIKENGLAGITFWEVSFDRQYDAPAITLHGKSYPLSLIATAKQELQ